VAEFERLSQIPEALESAANLYVGEFVPYLEHEWIVAFRERLRRRACRVLEQLIKQKSASGDIVGALNYTEELLAHDPWREDALRQLMLLRFRVSDRAGALAYYRGFRERLRAEFDVDPMPETVKCHEMILVGKLTVLNGNGGFEKCQG
jgi:DNA-binding SARP family transcriptional activator